MNTDIEVLRDSHPEEACPIGPVVEIVFSRWTTPILWTLNESGSLRFGELERRLGSITPKVLTDTLRKLERDGLVLRTSHPGIPARVEYEISELGRSLSGVFQVLATWSDGNLDKVRQARADYEERDLARMRR
ncbi:winged helix-turn-helix transcriptional regulator [Actinacidiphila guanduensis]|jgi:DNA-binding HxlR family transcriptional regulator|uniref:Transcriptional regulator, HxlR family n=1 Tax=Actinacidiphila guanduensis TaxID=310781 RepID=A0A1H0H0X1_9ACTN|nr:helix-turn-helix domain-containing protein [Actinacidiphila guanduensis]SDO12798.1 transcriptional regulator, HxlR family [Actinacidiphila guanduensis]